MKEFNEDEVFGPILAEIENGEIKTTHQLRLVLESTSENYHVRTLKLLEAFRVWLLKKDIDLSTENGVVTLIKMPT